MNKNNNKHEKSDINVDEYNKSISKIILKDFNLLDNYENIEEIFSLIQSLSFYMEKSNPAYKYNLVFLPTQYKKFVLFIEKAKVKRKLLQNVIEEIQNSEQIRKLDINQKKQTYISLNDLLISDLIGQIDTHENFLVAGAMRKPKEDVFTIEYIDEDKQIKKIRTIKVEIDDIKEDCLPLIRLTEDVLGIKHIDSKGEQLHVGKN